MKNNLYTFHNVSISISAPSAKRAYTILCNRHLAGTADFETTTWSKVEARQNEEVELPTTLLFPKM